MRVLYDLLPVAVAAVCLGSATAQSAFVQVDGARNGVSIDSTYEAAGRSLQAELPAGEWSLLFGAGGGGRPAPLSFAVDPGEVVMVAVGDPPSPQERPTVLAESLATGELFGEPDTRDLRIAARVRFESPNGACGLVCRQSSAGGYYRLVWDAASAQLRLERHLGEQVVALAVADAPANANEWHDLELQVDGFRLQAFCDNRPVGQVMDGAVDKGRYGTYVSEDTEVLFEQLAVASPAKPVASVASVTRTGHTSFYGQVPNAPESGYVLCLRLDIPLSVWPVGPSGFEPFLMQPPAEPVLLIRSAMGLVGPRGAIETGFSWPAGSMLLGQAALLGGFLSTPDQQALLGRLPWTAIRF